MKFNIRFVAPALLLALSFSAARAENYQSTVTVFQHAGASSGYFGNCYGYAVFPTVGAGGLGVGGAYGRGHVYVHGAYVGDTTMGEVSVGFQAGGKAYSQIIFFEDKRSLEEFESGNFEFGADASVVAITAGVNVGAGTVGGVDAGASAGPHDATTHGRYHKGMAVFTVAKGGLMYEASVAGQKFSYKARTAT
jgi:lipid-binding SYLF domain-containing protein